MTIAITGASGPYASRVRADLLAAGVDPADLVLITRTPEALSDAQEAGSKVIRGDFDHVEPLAAALRGVDQMLMISTSKVGSREQQHTNAVRAAVKAQVGRVIYTSYTGKGADNPSLAVKDHRLTEQALQESGLGYVILRNSQYMDAFTDAVGPHFIRSGVWRCAAGYGRIGLVARDDCAAAAAGVLSGRGKTDTIYEITGPELLSYADLAVVLGEIAGRHIEYQPVSEEEMYRDFDARGIPRVAVPDAEVGGVPWSSDDMISVDRAIRLGYMDVISDHVRQLSGKEPVQFSDFAAARSSLLRAAATELTQPI